MARTNTNTGGGGGGTGTVTSVAGANSIVSTPNPITGAGTLQLVGDLPLGSINNGDRYGKEGGVLGFFPTSGASLIADTYANLTTLANANGVTQGAFYLVTDRADMGIILQGAEDNEYTLQGSAGFMNTDYNQIGDYSDCPDFGGAPASLVGTWSLNGFYSINNVVIYNGFHYQNITGVNSSFPDTPETDPTNWFLLAKDPTQNFGYIKEWDYIEFDFDNDWIQARKDKRNNSVTQAFALAGFGSSFDAFRWGDNLSYDNDVNSSFLVVNNVALGSRVQSNRLSVTATAFVDFYDSPVIFNQNVIDNSSQVLIQSFGTFFGNILSASSNITVGALYTGFDISNNLINKGVVTTATFGVGQDIGVFSDNVLENYSTVDLLPDGRVIVARNRFTNESYAALYNMPDDFKFQYNTLDDGFVNIAATIADVENNQILNSNLYINNNQIPTRFNLITNGSTALVIGSILSVNYSSFMDGVTVQFGDNSAYTNCRWSGVFNVNYDSSVSYTYRDKTFQQGFSNFDTTLDITGLTTLNIQTGLYNWVGKFILTSGSPTESIDEIIGYANHQTTYEPADGLTLTMVATKNIGSIAVNQLALEANTSVNLVGRATVSDNLVLLLDNGYQRQVGGSII